MSAAEPDSLSLLRVVLAFAVVFGLLGALGFGLRYIHARGFKMPGASGRHKRLEIIETLAVDARRRLVIVRCGEREHLLLLGVNQDIVIGEQRTDDRRQISGDAP